MVGDYQMRQKDGIPKDEILWDTYDMRGIGNGLQLDCS